MTSYHEVCHGSEASQRLKSSVEKKEIQRSNPVSKEGRKEGREVRKKESEHEREETKRKEKKREKRNAKRYF